MRASFPLLAFSTDADQRRRENSGSHADHVVMMHARHPGARVNKGSCLSLAVSAGMGWDGRVAQTAWGSGNRVDGTRGSKRVREEAEKQEPKHAKKNDQTKINQKHESSLSFLLLMMRVPFECRSVAVKICQSS